MNKILVSIIVPVYQSENFLEESVKSIINQTLRDIEIILVDDGSTDNSEAICNSIASRDHRVRIIHKKNEGQSSARNTGIEAARGEYIGFMDHDDFLYPDMCERLYHNAEKYQVDISAGSYIARNEQQILWHDRHTGKQYLYDNPQGVKAYLVREVVDNYVWTKLYKKKFIDEYHIRFEDGRGEEDFLFNHVAFTHARLSVMDDTPVYLYIEYSDSTCRTIHTKNLRKYLDDMCHRVQKIENSIQCNYPEFLLFAKRQTIMACVKMLSVMSTHKRTECEPFYTRIKKYLRDNASIVIQDRKYWNMSYIGVFLAAYAPSSVYFYLKKWRNSLATILPFSK